MRRDAPRVLFFHPGSLCSDAAANMAFLISTNIGFRNGTAPSNDGSLEPCVAVSGERPEDVPLPYYEAYPYVTTAAELVRAAGGRLKAEDNPDREDVEVEDEDEIENEDPDEGMEPNEYTPAPFVPVEGNTEEQNAADKAVWDQKELERIALLPDRSTLAVDHPAYKAPSGPKRQRRKASTRRGPGASEPNTPTPPPQPPGWNNNA